MLTDESEDREKLPSLFSPHLARDKDGKKPRGIEGIFATLGLYSFLGAKHKLSINNIACDGLAI